MAYNADNIAGLTGFNLVSRKVVSDVEGFYQFGFQKNINLVLDVHNAFDVAIDQLQLVLRYTPAGASEQVETLILDKNITIERLLPVDTLISASVVGNARYSDVSATITIPSGTQRVLSILVPFREAYARIIKKRFL